MSPGSNAVRFDRPTDVLKLLALEQVERDSFRANEVFDDEHTLYGGQVAAQALLAEGATVPGDRLPHSLHGYYLRGGDSSLPTVFHVDRDRDGRSYSARRVVAIQSGEVIFNASASFQVPEGGPDRQVEPMPEAGDPDRLPAYVLPRLISMEARVPAQPYLLDEIKDPTRFWACCTLPLPGDQLLHAALLTYLSDISSGLWPLHEQDYVGGPTLDHAVWFHRPVRMQDWVLLDVVPRTVAAGRGWYTGSVHSPEGTLVASLTQEMVFRRAKTR